MVSKDEKRWRAAAHIVMIVLSALAILPFILLIIASFTDEDVALKYGYSYFPQKLSLDAYRYIAENGATFFRAYGMTDQELWDFMCHKAKVATDDGPKFGPNGEAGGFQRINFSCPRAQLEEALNRIAEALDAL